MVAEAEVRAAHQGNGGKMDVAPLRTGVRGDVLLPGDAGYDAARKVWNGMIDKRPALIVRATGVADVIAAVAFARKQEMLLAVKGGGHNVAGNAVCDGGMVIDLSRMKGIRVDPERKTAVAQAGVLWGEFDHETQAFGLAVTGGLVSTTGIAGFTLGGGIGWLMRSYGLACDNLLSADIVTAAGELKHASATENPDLFWALKGGSGNFGVVTSLEFRLHAVGPTVLGGILFHRGEKARDLLRFYREFVKSAPDALTTMFGYITAPPAPFLPTEVHGKPLALIALLYNGPVEKGQKAVQPLRDFGAPVADLVGPLPYTALQGFLDPMWGPGLWNYWKSHYLDDLDDATIDTILEHVAKFPSPLCEFHLHHQEGAVSRVSKDESAFANRDATYVLNILGKWTGPADTEKNIGWVRSFWEALKPHATGRIYVNFLGDSSEEAVRASFGKETYDRLAAVKAAYDPTNFFRVNFNIPPKAGKA